jgi:hypothetical protein
MKFDDYIKSNKPLWVSVVLLGLAMLIPVYTVVFQGWHSGVPFGVWFAIQVGIFMPGIYLIRPLVFWIWVAFMLITGVLGIVTFEYYWRSVPDWMDARIPNGIGLAIRTWLWLTQAAILGLGAFGWLRFFKFRRGTSHKPSQPTAAAPPS